MTSRTKSFDVPVASAQGCAGAIPLFLCWWKLPYKCSISVIFSTLEKSYGTVVLTNIFFSSRNSYPRIFQSFPNKLSCLSSLLPLSLQSCFTKKPKQVQITYLMYVLAFPSGKTYGCFFRKTCPTRLQGMISRLPPHIHTRKEISVREASSGLCLSVLEQSESWC